jgi:hypothetical protein
MGAPVFLRTMNAVELQQTKVWVYQANRFLSPSEEGFIDQYMRRFIAQWRAHGLKLQGAYELKHHLFLIIKLTDEADYATGCSIDQSMKEVMQLEQALGLRFFDRQRVAYLMDNQVCQCSTKEFKELAAQGVVGQHTLVFDNTVTTIPDLADKWAKPAHLSWHNMLLPKP